ncbi:MAG: DegT/DnrJ/EryC1/StrS family aminotransferase [Nitrospiraceae bacterium]|nr:DegT/DnrJ/EryC1/StrS family aminotransferase [Nitrospiraceae bacterium]
MIPMVNLKKQLEEIRGEILSGMAEVVESGQYVLGKKVDEFEHRAAEYLDAKHAIGVASGTDALYLALKALDIKAGDEVITTPFTFFATVEAILYIGAVPVLADIDPVTFNMDPEKAARRITKKTRAILPVHIFGHPADMGRIGGLAKEYGLKVIEDCAQAFGASINGKKTGAIGDAGCFSFYPSKNLGGIGDGGLVTVQDDETAARVRILRNHGSRGGYMHEALGYNSRLDELQAAALLVKLKRIEDYNAKRRHKAALYTKILSGSRSILCPPPGGDGVSYHSVFHQFTIRHPHRDNLRQKLQEAGISSMIYYPIPIHMQPALHFLGYKEGDFPEAEKAAREVLSLPICPEIADSDVEMIAAKIAESN